MGEKKCSRCGEVKPLAEFSRAARGRDGRSAHCKTCHNTLYREPLNRVPLLTCLYCGEEFPNPARRGPDRKFCSPHHKAKWWQEEKRRQQELADPRRCAKCGGTVAHLTGLPVCSKCRVDDRERGYRRAVSLKSLYGLTQDDYDQLLELQYGRCAICRTDKPGGGAGRWHIDHDHETGHVRGLLCNGCNVGIGFLQEDPEILMAAARYVMKHRATAQPNGRSIID
jgi:hypothetical protein